MASNNLKTAKEFWTSRKEYPEFTEYTKERHAHDKQFLISYFDSNNFRSVVDVGCGDGRIVNELHSRYPSIKFYPLDLAPELFETNNPEIKAEFYDFYSSGTLPEADVTMLIGSIQYIMDDATLDDVFSKVRSETVIIKTACTSEPQSLTINRYSEKLKAKYACRYLTLGNTLMALSRFFKVECVQRAYPDYIDSKYNSYQWWITAQKR